MSVEYALIDLLFAASYEYERALPDPSFVEVATVAWGQEVSLLPDQSVRGEIEGVLGVLCLDLWVVHQSLKLFRVGG